MALAPVMMPDAPSYAKENENIDVKGVNAMILMNYFTSEVNA